jgi:hypothetical protein
VCPLCWREQPTLLLPWSLHHITTCPIPQVFLVDLCNVCGKQLAIDLRSGTCAHCEYELRRLPASMLDGSEEQKELTELLWSAIGCSEIPFPPAYPALPARHPFHQMQPAALLQFLWQGSQFVFNRDPENPLFSWKEAPQKRIARCHPNYASAVRKAETLSEQGFVKENCKLQRQTEQVVPSSTVHWCVPSSPPTA